MHLNGCIFQSSLFYNVVIVVLITLWNNFKLRINQWKGIKTDDGFIGIQECLNKVDLKELFKAFADSEWSSENYLLYYDIQTFKKMKESDLLDFAILLNCTYLSRDSELEVNLGQNHIKD
jgi:hypothetical protein